MEKTEDSIIILDETGGISKRGKILKLLAKKFGITYVTSSKGVLKWLKNKPRKF